ncbi:MAG: hypothetical protein J5965_05620, partial [Aeriscardovia sp.]|nr:hypothetical protein [Aeriscardovia sp.]
MHDGAGAAAPTNYLFDKVTYSDGNVILTTFSPFLFQFCAQLFADLINSYYFCRQVLANRRNTALPRQNRGF